MLYLMYQIKIIMKTIKITPKQSTEFLTKYNESNEPKFTICTKSDVLYGFKAIQKTNKAVFVYASSFLWCGGFWMPNEIYALVKDGYLVVKKDEKINYNDTIYQY